MTGVDRANDRPRTGRKRGWALVASLALNLFLAGWIVGAWTRPPPPPPFALAERLKQSLSPAGRARVAAELDQLDTAMVDTFARFETARHGIAAVIGRADFDAEALRATLSALSDVRGADERRITDRLVALLAQLDGADRARVAAALLGPPGPPPRP